MKHFDEDDEKNLNAEGLTERELDKIMLKKAVYFILKNE